MLNLLFLLILLKQVVKITSTCITSEDNTKITCTDVLIHSLLQETDLILKVRLLFNTSLPTLWAQHIFRVRPVLKLLKLFSWVFWNDSIVWLMKCFKLVVSHLKTFLLIGDYCIYRLYVCIIDVSALLITWTMPSVFWFFYEIYIWCLCSSEKIFRILFIGICNALLYNLIILWNIYAFYNY